MSGASFEGGWGTSPPPQGKRKEEKRKNKEKKGKKEKRKKGILNSVKLLHIKCCFFQFFNSPLALKFFFKLPPPKEKVEMTRLIFMVTIMQFDCSLNVHFNLFPWRVYAGSQWCRIEFGYYGNIWINLNCYADKLQSRTHPDKDMFRIRLLPMA